MHLVVAADQVLGSLAGGEQARVCVHLIAEQDVRLLEQPVVERGVAQLEAGDVERTNHAAWEWNRILDDAGAEGAKRHFAVVVIRARPLSEAATSRMAPEAPMMFRST